MSNKAFCRSYGPWALVTGASSGIGAEFARQLAAKGLNLLLVARRAERLQQLADEMSSQHGVEVRVLVQNLASDDFMSALKATTGDLEIGLLINAAGFANTGPLLDNSIETEQQLLAVNCRAPLVMSHYFGNAMRQRGRGGIIFLASIVAFNAVPLWGNYAATKSYNLLLAEALGTELKRHGVAVMALCPGSTATEFQQVAGIRKVLAMPAQRVVSEALHALGHKRVLIPGWINRYNNFWLGLFPRGLSTRILASVMERLWLK